MAANSQVLREYLLSLGFKVDLKKQRDFIDVLQVTGKAALSAGKDLLALGATVIASAVLYSRSMEKLYFAAKRAGTTVEELQTMGRAAERLGISSEEMTGAIQGFANAIKSNPGMTAFIRNLGVQTRGRTTAQMMLDTLDRVRKMPGLKGQNIMQEYFGMDPVMYRTLTENWEEFNEQIAKQIELNKKHGVEVEKNAEAFHKWENAVRDLTTELSFLQGAIATRLLPALGTTTVWLTGLIQGFTDAVTNAHTFGEALDMIGKKAQPTPNAGRFISPTGMATHWLMGKLGLPGIKWGQSATGSDGTAEVSQLNDRVRNYLLDLGHEDEASVIRGFNNPKGGASGDTSGGPADRSGYMAGIERKYGLPKGLLDFVWNRESGRGRAMMSGKGAAGHFGFIPSTAASYGISGKENDFEASGDASGRMWRDLLQQYHGDLGLAAAGYNYGGGKLASIAKGQLGLTPAETQNYARDLKASVVQTNQFNITGTNASTITREVATHMKDSAGNIGRDMQQVMQ